MQTGIIIALSVTTGVLLLLFMFKAVTSAVGKKLERQISKRFDTREIVGATTRANFFGVQSKGGRQVRGNGALVLTKTQLFFLRAAPEKEYVVPLKSIQKVSLPKMFNGRSVFAPLLCVHYVDGDQQDAMAWALKEPAKWKDAIEALTFS